MNWQTLQASLRANGIVRLLLSKVVTFRFWPIARIQHDARKRPRGYSRAAAVRLLDFSLLGNLQGIVYLDA